MKLISSVFVVLIIKVSVGIPFNITREVILNGT